MHRIKEAVSKNVSSPRKGEKFKVTRILRASAILEEDSQVGIVLFVGVSDEKGFNETQICDYLCIEKEEYAYKLKKYNQKKKLNKRFQNKIKLIKNYLNHKYNY